MEQFPNTACKCDGSKVSWGTTVSFLENQDGLCLTPESDSSYTNIVQPFLYGPEASESSNSSWSDFDEESSCSGDESSARIGNTDLYAYFVLLHVYKYH